MNFQEQQAPMHTPKASTFPGKDNGQPEPQGRTETSLRRYQTDKPDNNTIAETNH